MNSLYEANDYKVYLRELIETFPNEGRGVRKALAETMGVQTPFITHVLSGDYHFSPEQAEGAARHFAFTEEETEFFLLLISFNRASTSSLRAFLKKQLEQRRGTHRQLQKKLKLDSAMSEKDRAVYYSSWAYAAAHMATTFQKSPNLEKILEITGLSDLAAKKVLEFLLQKNLIVKEGATYKARVPALHLEGTSPFISAHHMGWRHRAIQSLDRMTEDDLHYSAVFSCSEKDLGKVREILVKALQDSVKLIQASPEDQLAAVCLDLFSL